MSTNVLDTPVSLFPRITSTTQATNLPLRDVLAIVRSPQHAARIDLIRHCINPEEYKTLKTTLPCFVPTGTFIERNSAGLAQHYGCVHTDIDHLGDCLPQVREQLCADAHVVFCFLSPGGDGLKINVLTNQVCETNAQYKHVWAYVAAMYKDTYGIMFDEGAKDVARPCYLSHDPDCFANAEALPLDVPSALPEPERDVTIDWDMPPPTNEQKALLVQEMLNAFDGEIFRTLYVHGDWNFYLNKEGNPDHNRAGYALLYCIGKYTDWHPAWMLSVFLDSQLATDIERKSNPEDYLRRSIRKLIAAHTDDADDSTGDQGASTSLPPFPLEVFPHAIARFIRESTAALPCPPDFIGCPRCPY